MSELQLFVLMLARTDIQHEVRPVNEHCGYRSAVQEVKVFTGPNTPETEHHIDNNGYYCHSSHWYFDASGKLVGTGAYE